MLVKLLSSVSLSIILSFSAMASCWEGAAMKYHIEPELLKAIAKVESGMNPVAMNKNTNGTYDIGIMQINSFHLPRLQKKGITEKLLIDDVCLSVRVGASILNDMIRVYGYNWEAVGAYNAGMAEDRKTLRMKYARRVWSVYMEYKEYDR